mmetsp:Transcript_65792/g.186816  ORF Transcript_65792/g.186816 Transcript_65792/m.186816 type:complete len:126 (-) Transcript_65792:1550-1927(-)
MEDSMMLSSSRGAGPSRGALRALSGAEVRELVWGSCAGLAVVGWRCREGLSGTVLCEAMGEAVRLWGEPGLLARAEFAPASRAQGLARRDGPCEAFGLSSAAVQLSGHGRSPASFLHSSSKELNL